MSETEEGHDITKRLSFISALWETGTTLSTGRSETFDIPQLWNKCIPLSWSNAELTQSVSMWSISEYSSFSIHQHRNTLELVVNDNRTQNKLISYGVLLSGEFLQCSQRVQNKHRSAEILQIIYCKLADLSWGLKKKEDSDFVIMQVKWKSAILSCSVSWPHTLTPMKDEAQIFMERLVATCGEDLRLFFCPLIHSSLCINDLWIIITPVTLSHLALYKLPLLFRNMCCLCSISEMILMNNKAGKF